jgi:hypothetical protein
MFFILAFLMSVVSSGKSQPRFESHISLGSNSAAIDAFESQDGGIYTCLYSYQIDAIEPMVARLDNIGKIEWVRKPNDSTIDRTLGVRLIEGFESEVVLAEYVAINWSTQGIRLTAYDRDGKRRWSNVMQLTNSLISYSITRDDNDSSFLIAVDVWDTVRHLSFIKTDNRGNILWSHAYKHETPTYSLGYPFAVATEKGYCIISSIGTWDNGIMAVLISRNGDLLAESPIHHIGMSDYVMSATKLQNGDVVVSGGTSDGFEYSSFIACLDSSFSTWEWTKMVRSPYLINSSSCTTANDGNIVAVCSAQKVIRPTNDQYLLDSIVVLRISPAGQFLSGSMMAIKGTGQQGHSIARAKDNGYLISGRMTDSLYSGTVSLVLKIDSSLSGCHFEPFTASLTDTGITFVETGVIESDTSMKNIYHNFEDDSTTNYMIIDLCNSVSVHQTTSLSSDIQTYPNPSSGKSIIPYILTSSSPVTITLHDLLGREVLRREMGMRTEGKHEETLDVSELPIGSYILKIHTDKEVFTSRISVVR